MALLVLESDGDGCGDWREGRVIGGVNEALLEAGGEKEGVFADGSAFGDAEGVEPGVEGAAESIGRGEGARAAGVEGVTTATVGAAFGGDVDEAGVGEPDAGVDTTAD